MIEKIHKYPLTESVYYILLSLYTPLHGYGIMQFVKIISRERVSMGPGTLYGAINTLLGKGWIEENKSQDIKDTRKKEYVITKLGRQVVCSEIERLEELALNGRNIAGGEIRDN